MTRRHDDGDDVGKGSQKMEGTNKHGFNAFIVYSQNGKKGQ